MAGFELRFQDPEADDIKMVHLPYYTFNQEQDSEKHMTFQTHDVILIRHEYAQKASRHISRLC